MNQKCPNRPNERLVVLATFDTASEAHCLRMMLEHQGINATVANETSAQAVGLSLFGRLAAIYIEVLVLEADLKRAVEIKNNYYARRKKTMLPEWNCRCGETIDAGFAICWACGAEYSDSI